MATVRWQQIKNAFQAASGMEAGERASYLAALAGSDPELHREIVSLLESSGEAGTFLESPALVPVPVPEPFQDTMLGQLVGPYRILQRCDDGGVGAVYLAERADGAFEKRVAVKILKRGVDTDYVLRHFHEERQILALLDHANVARMLDAGATADGRPYFVMEYIDGRPLDRYCEERNLDVPQRLRLFYTVCLAVQHAHDRQIIHRDLKPSNILVTADGAPKLLDFGIAKWTSPERVREKTLTIERMLTPGYASPEQVTGGQVTAATDVYSLGVVLYQLLTRRRPFDVKATTAEQWLATVSTADPPPPGVSADLDAIALKALRPQAHERYPSPLALAEDIDRYLHHQPVSAHQGRLRYSVRKFWLRRRKAVAALAAVFLLVAGARYLAIRNGAPLADAGLSRPTNTEAARRFEEGLDRLRALDGLRARAAFEAASRTDTDHALTYAMLASAIALTGDDAGAGAAAARALGLRGNLSREEHLLIEARHAEMTGQQQRATEAYRSLYSFFPDRIDYGLHLAEHLTASGAAREALTITESLRRLPSPASDDPRIDLAEAGAAAATGDFKRSASAGALAASKGANEPMLVARGRLLQGNALGHLGETEPAHAALAESRNLYELAGNRRGLALVLNGSGGASLDRGDLTAARQKYEQALTLSRQVGFRLGAASALNNLGIVLKREGAFDAAVKAYEESAALRREIGDRYGLATALNNLANALLEKGELARAQGLYLESIDIARQTGDQRALARALLNLGVVFRYQLKLAEAKRTQQESLAIRREISPPAAGEALVNLGEVHALEGDLPAARAAFEEAIRIFKAAQVKRPLSYSLAGLGSVARLEGRPEAEPRLREAIRLQFEAQENNAAALTRIQLAQLHLDRGQSEQARDLAEKAAAQLRAQQSDQSEALALSVLSLAQGALGERKAARASAERAVELTRNSEYRENRLLARAAAARDHPEELEALLAEATQLGLIGYQFQIRYLLADLSGSQTRFEALRQDAAAKGFHAIAALSAKK